MKPSRNYSLLLISQFLGAFGDNAILMLILGPLMAQLNNGTITTKQQQISNILYTSLLFIPYVFLAPVAGYLNDRFSKKRWLMGGNFIKVIGTGIAASSLLGGSMWVGLGYFIIGIGACVYSPAKYGILPEILPTERLVKANGTVELLTLVAILTGNILGAMMFDKLRLQTCYLIVMAVYGASLGLNCFMSPTPSYPEVLLRDSAREFFHNAGELLRNKRLARVLVGTSIFWICGAMMKMNFQPWGQQVLKLQTVTDISLLGLWLSIGVMFGSVLAGQLYKVGDLRATRRWGWLLSMAIVLLGGLDWLVHHGFDWPRVIAITVLIVAGLLAGLFLIPLNAALQAESHKDKLGKTIATQNGFENLAMLSGSAFAWVNVNIGLDPSQLFMGLAAFVFVIVAWLKFPTTLVNNTKEQHETNPLAR